MKKFIISMSSVFTVIGTAITVVALFIRLVKRVSPLLKVIK